MTKGMMTLEEDMEAFGKKMLATQYDKNCDKENKDRSCSLTYMLM